MRHIVPLPWGVCIGVRIIHRTVDPRMWLKVLVALAAAAVACGCGPGPSPPMAQELPRQVPTEGLLVKVLYGRAVPEPFPLYPGATVYGSALSRVGERGLVATILVGAYADWEDVADFYEETWVGEREDEYESLPYSAVHFRAEKEASNRVAVWVERDARGLSRELSEWDAVAEGADPDLIRYGDPAETMMYIIVKWSGR